MKLLVLIAFSSLLSFCAARIDIQTQVNYLQQGSKSEFKAGFHPQHHRLQVYCYEGKPKYVIHLWQSVVLHITAEDDSYIVYEGTTPEEVAKEYEEHRSSWWLNFFSWKRKQLKLDPFNQSCVGIYSNVNYTIHLHVIRIDYWKLLYLASGVMLFLSADRLSKNMLFYYICGISFGIAASFLILIYFFSKLFPKKPMMYGVAAAGWTVGIYILQLLWDNIRLILMEYKVYMAYYAGFVGIVSFMVCYRYGPIENERTRNLIKWTLQALGLIGIFCSSHFQEAAMGQIVILLILYNTPKHWLSKPRTYCGGVGSRKRKFPPKVKLLSSDEYYQQGVRETEKALNNLREFCSSPTCNQWKTALKLKDVKRFASFVEGDSHLSDEEVLEYETSFNPISVTDDEEELYTDEEN